ncbi:MAG TPA: hypothetical protein VGH23_16360 [Rhizomicrobium sp.]|jgi:hypothetical protein
MSDKPRKRLTRPFREIQVIETLIRQDVVIPCYRCKIPFTLDDVKSKNIQKEHIHEVILGGPDVPDNCRFSHAAAPCHHTVTNGNGATSAGSSKHKAAKIRPKRTQKFVVEKPVLRSAEERQMKHGAGLSPSKAGTGFPTRSIPSRKFPTLQRGFARRGSRPMNKKRRA